MALEMEMVDVGIWECVEVGAMKGADGVPVGLQSNLRLVRGSSENSHLDCRL
jgi:hypothetical protein